MCVCVHKGRQNAQQMPLEFSPALFLRSVAVVKTTTWSDRLLSFDHFTRFNDFPLSFYSTQLLL